MPSQQLSDWSTRARAFVLDQLIVVGVAVALAIVPASLTDDPRGQSGELVITGVALVVSCLYAPLLMARSGRRNGQTIGKQLVGIRVVRADGAPVGFWTGVLRTVVGQQLLTAVTFYVYAALDYFWPLRDPQNQALHDKLAKTLVVRVVAAAPPSPSPFGDSPSPFGDAPSPFGTPPSAPPLPLPDREEAPVQGWLPPRAPGA